MSTIQTLSTVFSLSTSVLFLFHGIMMCANQSYYSLVAGLDAFTAPSVALYISVWYGVFYGAHFVFPQSLWLFTHGKPLPEEAFVMWKSTSFAAFMVGVLPLAFKPSWRVFAYALFFWPLHLFLTHVPLTLLDSQPRVYMLAAPLHSFVALLPVLFIDATTL